METPKTFASLENVIPAPNGLKPLEFPYNAVIIQLVPHTDEDGERTFERIVSLSVIDDDMKAPLREEAHRIIGF